MRNPVFLPGAFTGKSIFLSCIPARIPQVLVQVIGRTPFKHKLHKFTWESPNHQDRNQIDHIAINGRYRRSLLDTRAMKSSNVGRDHHLVIIIMAKLRVKLTTVGIERLERGEG